MIHRGLRASLLAVLTIAFAVTADMAQAAPPANDDFANATSISTIPFTDLTTTNAEATLEPAEQQPQMGDCGGSEITHTVWYTYQPSVTTTLQADTLDSDFDTMVAVWTGGPFGSLTEVECNDQVGGNQSGVVFSAIGGTTYYFQVGSWEGEETGDVRFKLGPPTLGEIAGTVTAEGGGGLPDVCVTLVSSGSFGFTFTGADGSYEIPVQPGTYNLLFEDFCDQETNYVSEWYDDKPDLASADDVAVPPATTVPGIDAELALGGSITGTVTAIGGGALRDICITVYDSNGDEIGFAVTDLAGGYSVGGLRTGSYKVNFLDGCDTSENHIEEWFNDKLDFASADAVGVTQGITTPGIHAAMQRVGGPAAPPPTGKTVTLKARPKRVERGERVKLTAFVTPCPGTEGQIVELYRGAKKVQAQATNTLCGATFRIRIQRAASFRAVSPQQDPNHLTGSSEPVKVKIKN